ncbi:MAG: ligase-associated DNA damage response exonuclease [Pseudomonadota bacterium]|nr:ligase-associated DNA damage response exonuclease [Pseudomonadota bacterium]
MRTDEILTLTPAGLYCPPGDVHIDPMRPVPRALVTHGHSDHARPGHGAVLATAETLGLMAARYGEGFAGTTQAAVLGERLDLGGVRVRFAPAGHVLGSAQIEIEAGGLRVVVSGDYKRQADPTARPFELMPCDVFITEATFGLPVFRHPDARAEIEKLLASLRLFPERPHLIGAYALGKAQRVIALLREAGYDRPIHIHGAMARLCAFYERQGVRLGELRLATAETRRSIGGEIVVCPPSALKELWAWRFNDPITAFASGWMRVRQRARQKGVELPLVISDHADWDDLCRTILETGAREIWVTHGQEDALVHWALNRGLAAKPLHLIGYGDEEEADAPVEEGAE